MIEMLGVLAIIGVLSAGGIMGYSTAMENYKVNQTVDDVAKMSMQIRNVFNKKLSSALDFFGDVNTLKQLGIIPDVYKITSDVVEGKYTAISRFGTQFKFEIKTADKFDRAIFAFYSLPYTTCVKLVAKDWKNIIDVTPDIRVAKTGDGNYAVLIREDTDLKSGELYCGKANTNAVYITYYFNRQS